MGPGSDSPTSWRYRTRRTPPQRSRASWPPKSSPRAQDRLILLKPSGDARGVEGVPNADGGSHIRSLTWRLMVQDLSQRFAPIRSNHGVDQLLADFDFDGLIALLGIHWIDRLQKLPFLEWVQILIFSDNFVDLVGLDRPILREIACKFDGAERFRMPTLCKPACQSLGNGALDQIGGHVCSPFTTEIRESGGLGFRFQLIDANSPHVSMEGRHQIVKSFPLHHSHQSIFIETCAGIEGEHPDSAQLSRIRVDQSVCFFIPPFGTQFRDQLLNKIAPFVDARVLGHELHESICRALRNGTFDAAFAADGLRILRGKLPLSIFLRLHRRPVIMIGVRQRRLNGLGETITSEQDPHNQRSNE